MKKALVLIFAVCSCVVRAADDSQVKIRIPVDPLGFPLPIPVSISGFSGEADAVLRFDLSFMGFEFVSPDQARYNIQKNNAAGVGAQISDPLSRESIYNKAFTGPSTRQQTHALADDIAKTLTQKPGIARTRIAFKVRPKSYGEAEIFISDYDGFNAQPVTKDGAFCASPSWAGNGSLFYMSHKISGKPDILSHNLSTGARKQVNRLPADAFSPAVSPDGRRFAMILAKSGSPDLWVGDVEGGNLKQLTMGKEDESSPCWSPDGSKICFTSRQSGRPQLYTIPATGGTMQRISISGVSNLSEPDWSPDGKYIVFTANMGSFQICVVPMEGSSRGTATVLVAGEDPVWAPNSRAVMFVKKDANERHILTLLDVPSKKTKEIGLIKGDASQPSWAK